MSAAGTRKAGSRARRVVAAAVACVAAAAALVGCGSLRDTEGPRYFVLDVPAAAAVSASSPAYGTAVLLVAQTTASSFYDTHELVFSKAPNERAYYQHSSWTEPPARAIAPLLVQRLDQRGAFARVALSTSGGRGTVMLRSHLVEMFHDAATPPGQVRITLDVELVDMAARTPLRHRTFRATEPVARYDASGAVLAFDRALASLLDDIAAWASAMPPR